MTVEDPVSSVPKEDIQNHQIDQLKSWNYGKKKKNDEEIK